MKERTLNEKLVVIVASACSLIFLYTAMFGQFVAEVQRSLLLMFGLSIVFLSTPMFKNKEVKWSRYVDYLLVVLSIIVCAYIIIFQRDIVIRAGRAQPWDWYLCLILVGLLFEASRRSMGLAMPIIAMCGLLYAFFGNHLPAVVAHRGFTPKQMLSTVFLTTEGIWGTCLAVASGIIVYFMIFTSFLAATGANDAFLKISNSLMGRVRGGPAKMAVVASGIFGTISGSSAANVAGSGSITIPLMKKSGYRPEFAGAVEAVASTGGQLVPPIMGSAAFIMAEVLGIKYTTVCLAAIVPSLLYYMSVFISVDLEAVKSGLTGLPKDQVPSFYKTLKAWWPVLLPLFLLIFLLIIQMSPPRAALYSLAALVILSFVRAETRLTRGRLIDALVSGAVDMAPMTIVCGVAGIIIGVLGRTGLGVRIAEIILTVSGGNMLFILVLTMFASLVMGMGMPTVACYILLALSVAPAIANAGAPPLAAHMFVFYFGIISAITPPVAIASYTAAGIAKADMNKLSIWAVRLGLPAFILPFMFVYAPEILMIPGENNMLRVILGTIIGVTCMTISVSGYFVTDLNMVQRIVLFSAALLTIHPNTVTDVIGLSMIIITFGLHYISIKKNRKSKPRQAEEAEANDYSEERE